MGKYFRCIICIAVLVAYGRAHAQTGVWGNKNTGGHGGGVSGKVGRYKQYGAYLARWGTDTTWKHSFLAGGRLNTDGWAGSLYFMKRKGPQTHVWQITFAEVKHEKQAKQKGTNKTFPELGNPTPYVFGKINNLYTLQVGYGREGILLPGLIEGGVSIGYRYQVGLCVAMLKPYYLKMTQVDYSTTPETATMIQGAYTREDSAIFLNPARILGASTWTRGLGETHFAPGAYLDLAIVIMPGRLKAFVKVITLGCNAAVYSRQLPIMYGQQAYPWTANLYAGLALGKRW